MSRRAQRKKPVAEINVVPYIDVMLVLVVIFMITAPMLTQGIKVKLPQASAQKIDYEQAPPIIVTVNKEGKLFINESDIENQALSPDALLIRIKAELSIAEEKKTKRQVLLRGDEATPYGVVVNAMAVIKKAGVSDLGLLTKLQQTDA